MAEKESLQQIANRHVPFPLAASWAEISFGGDPSERGSSKVYCPFGLMHNDQGREKAFRIYADHGFCFAEWRWFTPVSLLAAKWEVSREDAAIEALNRIGYVPADYAQLFAEAQRDPEPDRESLALALTEWCRSRSPDWTVRQYADPAAALLSRCLGLLPLVNTEDDCRRWLLGCQQAMAPHLTSVK